MTTSLILQRFSELLNSKKVLTHPQEFLGIYTPKVLDFWNRIENLTQEQLKIVNELYWAFYNENYSEWLKATKLAYDASEGVVGWKYAYNAVWTAEDVTKSGATRWATRELIGGVENPVFLKMFDNL